MPTAQRLMKLQLAKLGYNDTTTAGNGEEAWKIIEGATIPFDLILSDWNMPVWTGLDLVKQVRAFEPTRKTPFLLITAEGESSTLIAAMEAGITDYLLKPISAEALKEKFEKHLKN